MTCLFLLLLTFVGSENNFPNWVNGNNINAVADNLVNVQEVERFEQTYTLLADGKLSISNLNGSITIESWDRNEVKLVVIKTAETRNQLADIEIKVNSSINYLNIETQYPAWQANRDSNSKNTNYSKFEVEYRLIVPKTIILNKIETINGTINISNTTGFANVTSQNGNIRATNLLGKVFLWTDKGTIEANFDILEKTSQITLSTLNGQARLVIPSDSNATLRAYSLNGQINNDFGLPVRDGDYVGRNLFGQIGNGGSQIRLESIKGSLSIQHRQDGKPLNFTINLLKSREADFSNMLDDAVFNQIQNANTNNKNDATENAINIKVKAVNNDDGLNDAIKGALADKKSMTIVRKQVSKAIADQEKSVSEKPN